MNSLDSKINTHSPELVVRKDLVKTVKGNAVVPSYVLEYPVFFKIAVSKSARRKAACWMTCSTPTLRLSRQS